MATNGNYKKDYEIVLTSGRDKQNRYLKRSSSVGMGEMTIPIFSSSTEAKIQFGRSEHVFVERFNSPGEPNSMGDANGGKGLDRESAQFSPYASVNFRNLKLRSQWSSGSQRQGNLQYSLAQHRHNNWETSAFGTSIHNVNRNPRYDSSHGVNNFQPEFRSFFIRPLKVAIGATYEIIVDGKLFAFKAPTLSGSPAHATNSEDIATALAVLINSYFPHYALGGWSIDHYKLNQGIIDTKIDYWTGGLLSVDFQGFQKKPQYDNGFITHPVPQNNIQYSWINGSYDSASFNTDRKRADGSTVTSSYLGYADLSNIVFTVPSYVADYVSPISQSDESAFSMKIKNNDNIFGFSSWQQIRQGDRNLEQIRDRKQNIFSVSNTERLVSLRRGFWTNTNQETSSYIEPLVTQKNYPIEHLISLRDNEKSMLRYSHGNAIEYFANKELNDLKNFSKKTSENLKDISGMYLSDAYLGRKEQNPVSGFESIKFKERIFPASINEGLKKIRVRRDFYDPKRRRPSFNRYDSSTEIKPLQSANDWWLSKREDRETPFQRLSLDDVWGYDENSLRTSFHDFANYCWPVEYYNGKFPSIWPLDGEQYYIYEGGNFYPHLSSSFLSSETRDAFAMSSLLTSSVLGEGELQHARTTFCGYLGTPVLAPIYARRFPEIVTDPWTAGEMEIYAGATQWMNGITASLNTETREPFDYTSFEGFAQQFKSKYKDYSLIPEFRVSDFISEEFLGDDDLTLMREREGGDFYVQNDEWLQVENGEITSSLGVSAKDSFFKTYTNSDFLKNFNIIQTSHPDTDKKLTLSCKAIKKFNPREGFYPVKRTLELAKLFSSSCGSSVFFPQTSPNGTDISAGVLNRTAVAPWFGPGILYNSIKSGVACSYWGSTAVGFQVTGTFEGSAYQGNTRSDISDGSIPRIKGIFAAAPFNLVVPFESLLNLNETFKDVGSDNIITIAAFEPHSSSYCPVAQNLVYMYPNQIKDSRYYQAMHNFLAETAKFFLEDEKLTSIYSGLDSDSNFFRFQSGSSYAMEIKFNQFNNVMYESGSAFGPPVDCSEGVKGFSFAPFTPAYMNPSGSDVYSSKALFVFRPTKEIYTVSEVLNSLEEYSGNESYIVDDAAAGTFTYNAGRPYIEKFELRDVYTKHTLSDTNYSEVATKNAMALSASLNFRQISSTKGVEYEALSGRPTTVFDKDTVVNSWVIQPKWEAPILDFSNAVDNYENNANMIGHTQRGMWHQKGEINKNGGGVFIDIRDFGVSEGFKSLADAVGFEKARHKLGKPAKNKKVKEAVVAIPFIMKGDNRQYFSIEQDSVEWWKTRDSDLREPSDSVKEMLKKMESYVMPPQFNFLYNKDILPISMYIFEFSHTFSQNDLVNMWQNLPPDLHLDFQEAKASVSHDLLTGELLSDVSDVQWLVFKVKQKAEWNYFKLTADSSDDSKFKFKFKNSGDRKVEPDYSYNWPYDFFSIVELVKIDAEIELKPKEKLSKFRI